MKTVRSLVGKSSVCRDDSSLESSNNQRRVMNNQLQTVLSCVLVLGACRAEPSRAPASDERSPATPAPSTPAASTEPAPSSPSPSGSEARAPSEEPRSNPILDTFEDDPADAAPVGFAFARTGKGALGKWLVKAEAGAPSGTKVLAQVDADSTNFRFPVATLEQPILKDVRVSVRCKVISGRVDQACGLVARYRDEGNYLITRANALEDNIRLYTVRDGKRDEIASHDIEVTPNVWHDYRFEVRGDHLQVFWDGQPVLDHHDATFTDAGRVGLWTKADSVTHFDDLRLETYE
jgi:hypothetical protein